MFHEHVTEFAGFPVEDFDPTAGLVHPDRVAYRLRLDWDAYDEGTRFDSLLHELTTDPQAPQLHALVIGDWGGVGQGEGAAEMLAVLLPAAARLANLKALFVGDIVVEESEVSWIIQTDLSPLLTAFPQLETLRVRGGNGLSLGAARHDHLKTLIIESGGLPASVLRELSSAHLPALEHLELWLGDDGYGWDGTTADLAPILAGNLFPKLRYLGLRNSCIADEVAAAVATAPIVARLQTLDLSMGNLSDVGAAALLTSPAIGRLRMLDLHHHYLTDETINPLKRLGVPLDLSDPHEPDTFGDEVYRYIAVSE